MRDFIDKKEGKLTVVRFVGFCLMVTGVLSLISCSFLSGEIIPNIVAVSFFITMLGFSLAFPTLLEGSEGLSTMRIVVFMITNVVSMLLLKIGWAKGVTSLHDIGVDQYWVGIIAFTFGAKATQSFFESRMAVPKETPPAGMAALEYTNAEIAKMAVAQNGQYLKVKFPNILTVSDSVKKRGKEDQYVVVIYLKDNRVSGIPDVLEVKMPDNTVKTIATEIIKDTGTPSIQYSQLHSKLSNTAGSEISRGSVCCAVQSTTNPDFKGIVTSAHIFTHGWYKNEYNGMLNQPERTEVLLNNVKCGNWYYKMLTDTQDFAVVKLDNTQLPDADYFSFGNKFYNVEDKDVMTKEANVTMLARDNRKKDAFIIDYNVGLDVKYRGGLSYKRNLILIGTTNDRAEIKPISEPGDSGGCVYHKESKELIGILLGSANNFSLVLPIGETLKSFNLITV